MGSIIRDTETGVSSRICVGDQMSLYEWKNPSPHSFRHKTIHVTSFNLGIYGILILTFVLVLKYFFEHVYTTNRRVNTRKFIPRYALNAQ
jgi:hypothetical protein